MNRRLQILSIGDSWMLDIIGKKMTDHTYAAVWPKIIPDGVKVVSVQHNFAGRCFDFILEHDSFDPVPEGHRVPAINAPEGCEYVKLWSADETVLTKRIEELEAEVSRLKWEQKVVEAAHASL